MNNDEMADTVVRIIVGALRREGYTQPQIDRIIDAATVSLQILQVTGAPLTNNYFICGLSVAARILHERKKLEKPPTPPTSSSVM